MKRYVLLLLLFPLLLPAQNRHSKGIGFVDLQAGAIYQGMGGYAFSLHGGKYLSQKLFFRAGINRNEFDYQAMGEHFIFERKLTGSGEPYLDTLWLSTRRHYRYETWFLSGDIHYSFFQPNEFLFFNVFGGARLGLEKRGDITRSKEDIEDLPNSFAAGGYAGLELELFLGSSLALFGQLRGDMLRDDLYTFRPSASGGIKICFK